MTRWLQNVGEKSPYPTVVIDTTVKYTASSTLQLGSYTFEMIVPSATYSTMAQRPTNVDAFNGCCSHCSVLKRHRPFGRVVGRVKREAAPAAAPARGANLFAGVRVSFWISNTCVPRLRAYAAAATTFSMSPFDPRLLRRVDVLKRDVIQRCSVLRVGTVSGAHDFFGQEKSLFLSMPATPGVPPWKYEVSVKKGKK